MIVRVLYRNEKYDMVKASSLDLMINSRKIKKFKRSEGWAVMGLDRVRGDGGKYKGPERRSCL